MNRHRDYRVRRMRRTKSANIKLFTKKRQMYADGEKSRLGVKMFDSRQTVTTKDDTYSGVLDELELAHRRRTSVREPDGCGVDEERPNNCLVRCQQRLFAVAPIRSGQRLQDMKALPSLGRDGSDVAREGEK